MQLDDDEEATLRYLDHVAIIALPGVIAAMGHRKSEYPSHGEWIEQRDLWKINVGETCYDIAWSMLRARRDEREQCEREHECGQREQKQEEA